MSELHPALVRDGMRFGGVVWTPSPDAVEAFVAAGFDFVILDLQHSILDQRDAARLLRPLAASPTAMLVRVRANDAAEIGYALDIGADGVIVPLVEDRAAAERAVAACRFFPEGNRSFGPIRGELGVDHLALQARAACFAMVESTRGVENAPEIARTPGLAGVFVGPVDLAITLGLTAMQYPYPAPLEEALTTLRAAARAGGVLSGFWAAPAVTAEDRIRFGYDLVTVAFDKALLARGAAERLAEIRSAASSAA